MKTLKIGIGKILIFFLFNGLIISCIPQKTLRYLQSTKPDSTSYQVNNNPPAYRIQPKDMLFIRFMTPDENISEALNVINTGKSGTMITEQTMQVFGNLVSDSGFILLPFLGKIKVANLTVNEIRDSIQKITNKYFNEVYAFVRIINLKVTILGEVAKPGTVSYINERINIFQAIGETGDLTLYGNRKNVKIIRMDNNKTKIITIDLTDKKILESPYYYLSNNDIIYIESMKSKNYSLGNFRLSSFINVIASAINLLILTKLVSK